MKEDFKSFKNRFRSEAGAKSKIKGLISIYLTDKFSQKVSLLISKNFTEKMVYLTIIKEDPSLNLKFNTFRSWIRKNFKKDRIKSQNSSSHNKDLIEYVDIASVPPNLQTTSPLYFQKEHIENSDYNSERDMYLPRPKLPLQVADKTTLQDLFGYDLEDFFIDSEGILFDGNSSDSESELVPIPCEFKVLAQQDGIRKHYFLYKDENIDSKNLLDFLLKKFKTGTFSFTYYHLILKRNK